MTEMKYQTKASRDSSRWETTTAVEIWRRDSITEMKEKERNKITCRAQSEKERREPEPFPTYLRSRRFT